MSKRPAFATIGCMILLLVVAQPVLAVDLAGRLRLGGTAGIAMSEQEDLNVIMDDLKEFWSAWEVDLGDSELRSVVFGGVYAEYLVNENWVVGVEFLRLSSSSGYDWYLETTDSTTDADASYDATGNLASVYGVYRLPLGDSPVALRLGAGMGYLFGAEFAMDFGVYREGRVEPGSRDTTLAWQADLRASGATVAFHGLVGAEYEFTDNLFFSVNFAYRVASVAELEVDDSSASLNGVPDESWDLEVGNTLRWYNGETGTYFSTVEGDKVGLDFSGLHIALSIAYVF